MRPLDMSTVGMQFFLVRSCLLITLIKCLKGHKSLGSLCSVVKTLIVSGAQPTDRQWVLLSCCGQLKRTICPECQVTTEGMLKNEFLLYQKNLDFCTKMKISSFKLVILTNQGYIGEVLTVSKWPQRNIWWILGGLQLASTTLWAS